MGKGNAMFCEGCLPDLVKRRVIARPPDPHRQSPCGYPRTYLRYDRSSLGLLGLCGSGSASSRMNAPLEPQLMCTSSVPHAQRTDLQAELFNISHELSPRPVRRRVRAHRSHAPAVSRPTRRLHRRWWWWCPNATMLRPQCTVSLRVPMFMMSELVPST